MRKYIVICFIEVIITVILCFLITWLNVTQIRLKYEISKLQSEYKEKKELKDKLETEVSVLFSPYNLKKLANRLGLEYIEPARVRKIK